MKNNILLDTVRISGFRGIKNLEMSMSRVTVLIGANNSGKTSLIKALHLAVGNYARYISKEDFFISANEASSNKIIVDIRFVSIDLNGTRVQKFDENWQILFADKIKFESNDNEYLAIRTCVEHGKVKGEYKCSRYTLQFWPDFSSWITIPPSKKPTQSRFLLNTPFISIEAQRDIHNELKDKYSFVGKVLANVEYPEKDLIEIEKDIEELNKIAVDKSEALKNLENV